jgi:hypothetical protein
MKCPRCQHENPPQAKFCLEYGARVALTRTKCRSGLPAGAKFCLECGEPVAPKATAEPRFTSPESYTPKHLAEKILTSKAALEGERKQVTVLFADLKGSMELLPDRDPEEARKILDPVLERKMEAVRTLRRADRPRGSRGAGMLSASASSTGARASPRKRRSISPLRRRCTARWG